MAGWRWRIRAGVRRALGRAAAIALVLVLIPSVLPSDPAVSAASWTQGGFTSSATVAALNAAPGGTVSISARVTSGLSRTMLVAVAVYGPTAAPLSRTTFDNQPFTAGVDRTFAVTWPVPADAVVGGYTIMVGVEDAGGNGRLRHWNDSAGFFTVGMASPPPDIPTRIIPLGDSLTDGYTFEGGYRIDLWTMLASAHHNVDFVGSRYNGPPGLADKQHEGHPGRRIDEVADGATAWLTAYRPRIVLLLIGTEDMVQAHDVDRAPARLGALIDQIKTTVPEAAVVVSSLPRVSDGEALQRIQTFNAAMPGIVAAGGSAVTFVDAYTAITAADLDADGRHLTANGYSRLAGVWYPAVHAILNSLPDPNPTATFTPTPTATLTPTQTATATLTPTVPIGPCAPRPPVLLSVSRSTPGVLAVTITATGTGNALREVRVGDARNATVTIGSQSGTGTFNVPLPGTPATVVLTVARLRAGETVHVPLVAADLCGDWSTFVGGGPTAF